MNIRATISTVISLAIMLGIFTTTCKTQVKQVLTAEQANQNPKEALVASMNRMFDGKSYQITVIHKNKEILCGEETLRFQSPNRYNYIFTEVFTSGIVRKDWIQIGDEPFERRSQNGPYEKGFILESGGGSYPKFFPEGKLLPILYKVSFNNLISEATVSTDKSNTDDSILMFKYSVTTPKNPDNGFERINFYTSVNKTTGLPSVSTADGSPLDYFRGCQTEIHYFNFDGNIIIERPIQIIKPYNQKSKTRRK